MATIVVDGEPWYVALCQRSLIAGSSLYLEADRSLNDAVIQIAAVREYENAWVLSSPLEADDTWRGTQGVCDAVADLPKGLYVLTALQIGTGAPEIGQPAPSLHRLPVPELFEIRANCQVTPRSSADLEAAYRDEIRRRQDRAEQGIGSGAVVATVLVFIKDLLMTTRLNLGYCQVVPLDPVTWRAETAHIDRFDAQGWDRISWSDEIQRVVQLAEPATLAHFQVVHGNSLEECSDMAIRETLLLNTLLAAHRGSLGEIYCHVVLQIAPQVGTMGYALHIPPHRGSLIGGFISGEEPESIRNSISALKASTTIQLYLTLFGEAIRERRPEFMYVRLWSLLETIAKGQRIAGQAALTWAGQSIREANGQPRSIQTARELVYELLRRNLGHDHSENSFAAALSYGGLNEQIEIWYRRRNCTAHGDPRCVCRDTSSMAGGSFATCHRARADDQSGVDHYLRNLQEVARIVMLRMLRDIWPLTN